MSTREALTVSELNEYVKMLLENNPTLKDIWVSGELSGVKVYASGHMYYSLKDKDSVLSAVMFRGSLMGLDFTPGDGMQVLMHGRVSAYVPRGQYQFICDRMIPEGAGSLAIAFEQLKNKLMAEGLFDESRKKPIPKHPHRIGIVTSPSGAAVHDIIRVAKGRYPGVELLIFPSLVQGERAAAYLAGGVNYFNTVKNDPEQGVDLIIIGRGGGSMEDLWVFNDERLARTIAASCIPVVSAVGHEVDFTICDFVSDLRAATPSAAAELTIPDAKAMVRRLDDLGVRLSKSLESKISRYTAVLDKLAKARVLTSPEAMVQRREESLALMEKRLTQIMTRRIERTSQRLIGLSGQLEALSPLSVLSRGYALAQDEQGRVVTTVGHVTEGDNLTLRLADGTVETRVTGVKPLDMKGT